VPGSGSLILASNLHRLLFSLRVEERRRKKRKKIKIPRLSLTFFLLAREWVVGREGEGKAQSDKKVSDGWPARSGSYSITFTPMGFVV